MEEASITQPVRRATIKTIARRAGVTTTTVSRALNDKPDISPATKARILAIAEEVGYVPSTLARSLVTQQRTHTIGLAVRTISDMWVIEIVPAIEEVLREAGYEVFISTHYVNAKREKHLIETFRSRQMDGIIVVSSVLPDEYTQLQAKWGIPIVLVSPLADAAHRYIVHTDDIGGAQLATNHLISLGHRRIGYIGVPSWIVRGQDRFKGYRLALEARGISFDSALVFEGDGHEEGGAEGIQGLMSLSNPPTAVFCFNDLTAIGALQQAKSMGLLVPRDLSLIGFDDVPLTQYFDPPLTTIHQDMNQLGRRAAWMALDLIARRETEAPITLETRLVVRGSTARV